MIIISQCNSESLPLNGSDEEKEPLETPGSERDVKIDVRRFPILSKHWPGLVGVFLSSNEEMMDVQSENYSLHFPRAFKKAL